jgi:hypothetical protein
MDGQRERKTSKERVEGLRSSHREEREKSCFLFSMQV